MIDFVPLDGPAVKRLFVDKRIVREKGSNLPDDLAFHLIAGAVNNLSRRDLARRNETAERVHRLGEAANLLQEFIEQSPKCMLDRHSTDYRVPPDGFFDLFLADKRFFPLTFKRDLGKVKDAINRMVSLTEVPTERDPASPLVWHEYVQHLEHIFKLAMRSTNPGLDLGRSKDGPVVRFVGAVIPLLFDKHPTGDAIRKELDRQAPRPA